MQLLPWLYREVIKMTKENMILIFLKSLLKQGNFTEEELENTKQYIKVGDILGAKGKIEKLSQDTPTKLVGEKITFLSTGKKSEEESE